MGKNTVYLFVSDWTNVWNQSQAKQWIFLLLNEFKQAFSTWWNSTIPWIFDLKHMSSWEEIPWCKDSWPLITLMTSVRGVYYTGMVIPILFLPITGSMFKFIQIFLPAHNYEHSFEFSYCNKSAYILEVVKTWIKFKKKKKIFVLCILLLFRIWCYFSGKR